MDAKGILRFTGAGGTHEVRASIALVVACLGRASCSQQKLIDQFASETQAAVAKSTLDDLSKGKLDTIGSRLG